MRRIRLRSQMQRQLLEHLAVELLLGPMILEEPHARRRRRALRRRGAGRVRRVRRGAGREDRHWLHRGPRLWGHRHVDLLHLWNRHLSCRRLAWLCCQVQGQFLQHLMVKILLRPRFGASRLAFPGFQEAMHNVAGHAHTVGSSLALLILATWGRPRPHGHAMLLRRGAEAPGAPRRVPGRFVVTLHGEEEVGAFAKMIHTFGRLLLGFRRRRRRCHGPVRLRSEVQGQFSKHLLVEFLLIGRQRRSAFCLATFWSSLLTRLEAGSFPLRSHHSIERCHGID
mmetsp:Transcript_58001/g.91742  ORF Transcript_58001/g.91742 Transcript_58001/m.91742 type:complete len:282 (-) Transcript_58001:203-1048(-)